MAALILAIREAFAIRPVSQSSGLDSQFSCLLEHKQRAIVWINQLHINLLQIVSDAFVAQEERTRWMILLWSYSCSE